MAGGHLLHSDVLQRFCDVRIEADGMSATLCLLDRPRDIVVRGAPRTKPGPCRDELPPEREIASFITALARDRGVVVSLDAGAVSAAVAAWARQGTRRQAVIAKGRPPRRGADGSIALYRPSPPPVPRTVSADRIQRRNQGFVVNVPRGALVAVVSPPTAGEPGLTVTGSPIAAEAGRPHVVQAAGLVDVQRRAEKTEYRAADDAILVELSPARIEISHRVELRCGVDHDTGNIDAWGDVVVHGSVDNGFSIRARGDVIVNGLCDSAYLDSGGSVSVTGGILGRKGPTEVKCRGDCHARFMENAKVSASGQVVVREFIVNSRVLASGRIVVEGRGDVLSSLLAARSSIEAGSAGSDAGLPLELIVGQDPALWLRWERVRREVRTLRRFCMKGLNRAARHGDPAASRKDVDRLARRRRMAAVVERVATRKAAMLARSLDDEHAVRVVFRKAVFPKTRLRLGPFALQVDEVLSAGMFVIDSTHGCVKWVPA